MGSFKYVNVDSNCNPSYLLSEGPDYQCIIDSTGETCSGIAVGTVSGWVCSEYSGTASCPNEPTCSSSSSSSSNCGGSYFDGGDCGGSYSGGSYGKESCGLCY